MLMTPPESISNFVPERFADAPMELPSYPDLAGKRILITGVSSEHGIDIVRAFAEHRTRLVVQCDEASEATLALAEMIAPTALDVSLIEGRPNGADETAAFARKAVATYNGVDAVINIVSLALGKTASGVGDIERRVSDLLLGACLVGRVAANRMRLTHTPGLVLNIAVLPMGATATERAFAAVAKATLTAMTRADADTWAREGVRMNAITPDTLGGIGGLESEADIAALALHLASRRGEALAGQIFDAAC